MKLNPLALVYCWWLVPSSLALEIQNRLLPDLDSLPPPDCPVQSLWEGRPFRVAIIGAGSAGSSTAYFLRKLEKENAHTSHSAPLSITIYERSDRAGGRARILSVNATACEDPLKDIDCHPAIHHVELGASIFAAKNHHLVDACKELNLTLNDLSGPGRDRLGVWDGEKWLIRQTGSVGGVGWLGDAVDKARIIARYGLLHGPIQAATAARDVAKRYFPVYDRLAQSRPFKRIDVLVRELGLWETVSTSSLEWFRDAKGINERFVDEIIGGITKNTYLQEIADTSAFGGAIALYSGTNDLFQVEGGNYQIFKGMLNGEDLQLNNSVTSLERVYRRGKTVFLVQSQTGGTEEYDAVVMAAPLPASLIQFRNISQSDFPDLKYVLLHVTLVVGTFDPSYFGLDSHSDVPESIVVPSDPTSITIPTVPFFTMGKKDLTSTTVLAKFFSPSPIENAILDEMFTVRSQTHRHVWNNPGSYPYLPVRDGTWKVPVEIVDGVYYANAMESWISTMETETVAGRNIANLIWGTVEEKARKEMGILQSCG